MQADAPPRDSTLVWPSSGADGLLLLCLSGLGGTAEEWTAVGPALARHGRVMAVELALGGGAAGANGASRLHGAVEAVDRALADAGEGSVGSVLIGHSMGALVSMVVAASHPHRLAGLVLSGPFVPAARHGRSTLATAADYARHRALFLAGARRRRRRARSPSLEPGARAAGLAVLARYGLRPAAFHALADRVSCPVLLVHGGDDHYVPPAFALAAGARHAAWQVTVLADAGHFAHRDDPAAWLAAVDPWLRGLPPRPTDDGCS